MTIEIIAIAYGDARYGRACANCNYAKKLIMGTICQLHGLETGLRNCCGTWCGEREKKTEEPQKELF